MVLHTRYQMIYIAVAGLEWFSGVTHFLNDPRIASSAAHINRPQLYYYTLLYARRIDATLSPSIGSSKISKNLAPWNKKIREKNIVSINLLKRTDIIYFNVTLVISCNVYNIYCY